MTPRELLQRSSCASELSHFAPLSLQVYFLTTTISIFLLYSLFVQDFVLVQASMTKTSFLLVGILVLLTLGAAAWFVFFPEDQQTPRFQNPSVSPPQELTKPVTVPPSPTTATPQSSSSPVAGVSDDWKTYRNEEYGFYFKYPPSAVVVHFDGQGTLLSHDSIIFESESSDWYVVRIDLIVYEKGAQRLPRKTDECEIYRHFTGTYDGKMVDIVEQKNCNTASFHNTGHTLVALIPLSDKEDLVYSTSLENSFIRENRFGEKILSTLRFAK